MVSPWFGAHIGAQRLRLSRHRCVTSSEVVVEVPQRAYLVREGQQAAGQVCRGSGGRAHPHPVYPPGLSKAAEGMDAQGGHLLDPAAQVGSALWAGQHRAHTRAAGSLACMTPQDSPRTQRVPWDTRSAALNSESLWKSLKVLCVREVGGADRTPGCVARGSEWADWGCPPPPGTSAEHVSLAASISLWTWMPPPPHFLKYTAALPPSTWQVGTFVPRAQNSSPVLLEDLSDAEQLAKAQPRPRALKRASSASCLSVSETLVNSFEESAWETSACQRL